MATTFKKTLSIGFKLVDDLKLNEAIALSDNLLSIHPGDNERGYVLILKGEALLYSEHYSLAASCFFETINLASGKTDNNLLAEAYCGLSYVYRFLEDYKTAIDYAQKTKVLLADNRSKIYIKGVLSEGISRARSGSIEEAALLLKEALHLSEEIKDEFFIITSIKCLADFYLNIKDYGHAIRLYEKALIHAANTHHFVLKTMILVRMAEAQEQSGDPDKSLATCLAGLEHATQHEFSSGEKSARQVLSRLYERKGDTEKALKHLKAFLQLQNSGDAPGQRHTINKMELTFVKESLDKEIYLLEQVQEKHKSITASIDYARGLQEAILPLNESLEDPFLDYFVFFKPKEKVGGDFYWIDRVESDFVFCVADCTGHGVPGAMLSMLCSDLVSQSVKAYKRLGLNAVLEAINRSLHAIFGNKKNLVTANDGMDLSLCSIEKNKKSGECVLKFSGANQTCIIIRDQEIVQTAYNRSGISLLTSIDYNFIETSYPLKKGDHIFLFSDGYPDQFGGTDNVMREAGGKKFKHRQLIGLFQNISKENMTVQKQLLKQSLEDWMGGLEQIDDICVLGIRFKGES